MKSPYVINCADVLEIFRKIENCWLFDTAARGDPFRISWWNLAPEN